MRNRYEKVDKPLFSFSSRTVGECSSLEPSIHFLHPRLELFCSEIRHLAYASSHMKTLFFIIQNEYRQTQIPLQTRLTERLARAMASFYEFDEFHIDALKAFFSDGGILGQETRDEIIKLFKPLIHHHQTIFIRIINIVSLGGIFPVDDI